MNYISLINNLWEKDREYNFSDKEIALYFYLLNECNCLTWKNPFGQSNAMMIAKFGWGKCSFDNAKKKLKDAGLIEFKAGDGRGNTYQYEIIDTEKVLKKGTSKIPLYNTLSPPLSRTLYQRKTETSININIDENENKKEKTLYTPKPPNEEVYKYQKVFSDCQALDFVEEQYTQSFGEWLKEKADRGEGYRTRGQIEKIYSLAKQYTNGDPVRFTEMVDKAIADGFKNLQPLDSWQKQKANPTAKGTRLSQGDTLPPPFEKTTLGVNEYLEQRQGKWIRTYGKGAQMIPPEASPRRYDDQYWNGTVWALNI